jgi:polyvinyl alcohol dehydrogenase (cytochrome)
MRTGQRRRLTITATVALLAAAPLHAAGAAETTCGEAATPGDWPSLNRDLSNTRHQQHEDVIGAGNVGALEPAWAVPVTDADALGAVMSTPIVAHGCVFVSVGPGQFGGPHGWVLALDLDNGNVEWSTELNGASIGLAVANGLVYAFPSGAPTPRAPTGVEEPAGAHAVALNAGTGQLVWTSDRLDEGTSRDGTYLNASPVVFDAAGESMLFAPIAGGGGDGARVPLYFLDALSGAVVEKFYALPDDAYEYGFSGAGIWTTAAFDASTNHLYAGTADSDGYRRQHPYNNAILKIDADPRRPSFASVVGAYRGNDEHYDLDRAGPAWQNNPVCEAGVSNTGLDDSQSIECLELDIDFGASPNLFTDTTGRTMITALQKSGVFHAVDTATMSAAWGPAPLSYPAALGNASTAAVDGNNVYVNSSPNGLFAFDRTTGSWRWASTSGEDLFSYQPMTVANGVLYTINDAGYLVAFDAATGAVLLHRPLWSDVSGTPNQCFGLGAGVTVAHHTVVAPCDAGNPLIAPDMPGTGWVVAYRLPDPA